MTVSRFVVDGMDCSAEEQLVRLRLDELDGIDRVAVDLSKRHVTVVHDGDHDRVGTALASLDLGARYLGEGSLAQEDSVAPGDPRRERQGLLIALVINAVLFVGEVAFGIISRSMGLIADGLDMGADAAVYALSLAAVGTSTLRKKQLARASGYLEFGLAFFGLAEVVRRVFIDRGPPDTTTMVVLSLVALAGNIATMVVLAKIKSDEVHLQASWIFTANDIKVNVLVIVAAGLVAITDSAIPDLLAGAAIFVIVANGARRIIALST